MTVTYGTYLHLDKLLSAQHPLSEGPEHDELLLLGPAPDLSDQQLVAAVAMLGEVARQL